MLGDAASAADIARTKADLEISLRGYFQDQVRESMTEGGARERAFVTLGSQRGTPLGEAFRSIMQFKRFPITFVTRHLGREFSRERKVDAAGPAQLIAATTLLGYASITAKDAFKGLTPRDPTSPATWIAAFTQGGGAGIYGDILTADYIRFGGGGLDTLAGPSVGTLGDVLRIYGNAGDRTMKGSSKLKAIEGGTLHFLTANTPFIYLSYTKFALNYLILYQQQEAISPGYLRRHERKRCSSRPGNTSICNRCAEAYPVDSGRPRCSVLSDRIGVVARRTTDGEGTVACGISSGISRREELRSVPVPAALAGWLYLPRVWQATRGVAESSGAFV